jgi:hypothetical protein
LIRSHFSNPFWTLELRRRVRQPLPLPVVIACLPAGLALLVVGAILLPLLNSNPVHPNVLPELHPGWLIALHVTFCCICGALGGVQIFAPDADRQRLDELRLLPWNPIALLASKFLFPLACLFILWSTALPVYVVAALLRPAHVEVVLGLALLPLAAGLFCGLAHAVVPLYWASEDGRSRQLYPDPRLRRLAGMALSAQLLVIGVLYTFTPSDSLTLQFFGKRSPVLLVAFVVLLLTLLLVGALGGAILVDNPARRRWATSWCCVAIGAALLIILGASWQALGEWAWWGAVLLLPLAYWAGARVGGSGGRARDRLGDREATRLIGLLENPVFALDLRLRCRKRSIRREILLGWPVMLLLPALFVRSPVAFPLILVAAGIVLLRSDPGREPTVSDDLLLTPLSSSEMLKGRVCAAFLYNMLNQLLGTLLIGAAAFIGAKQGYWVGPLAATLLVARCSLGAFRQPFCAPVGGADSRWLTFGSCASFLLLVLLMWKGSGWPPVAVVALGAGIAGADLLLTFAWFQANVKALDLGRGLSPAPPGLVNQTEP